MNGRHLQRFHPLSLQLGEELAQLDRAHTQLAGCAAGSIVVLPELLAWTRGKSAAAYAALASMARARQLTIVTSLNLGNELAEDLLGRDPHESYNALTIFTRFGAVHVPQAKMTPQGFERSHSLAGAGIGVAAYDRLNRVDLDVGDELLRVCFFLCSDLWLLTQLDPPEVACDLMIVLGTFARGSEIEAARVLAQARRAGAAKATVLVNAYQWLPDDTMPPLAVAVAELFDDGSAEPLAQWPDRAALTDSFRLLADEEETSFVAMVEAPARQGKIAVPRSCAGAPATLGSYPVTIVV